ncbi:MAG TPA: hypothetical protein VEZ71_13305, partial [Archangium sp.]|nr:hypothetical protein [Archangium sp.]
MQYLATGLQHEGVDVLRSLVKEVGLGYPETPARAILSIVWWLTRLKVRGHGFQARGVAQVAPDVLARLDMCWNVGKVLSNTDPLRGMPFQLRAVMMALEAGEPIRVARALGMLGAMFVWQGTPSTMAQGGALLDRAEELARDVTDDEARRLLVTAQAARDLVRGDWNLALERLEPAFRESQTVAIDPWDVYMMRVFINNALFGMGRLAEAHERAARWFREASEQGNTYGRTTAVACWGTTLLAIRGPEEARARLREVQESWPKEGFRVPDVYALQLETNCALYEGRPAEAWSRLKQVWPSMERSGLLRAQIVRLEMYSLRARTAVALAAVGGSEREKLLDSAMRDVRRVEQESRRDAGTMSRLLRAGIDSVRGNTGSALEHLTAAGEGFAAAGMELWAAHARVFQGVLLGGDAGRELRASAEAVIARQGILEPRRWLRLQVPGLEG